MLSVPGELSVGSFVWSDVSNASESPKADGWTIEFEKTLVGEKKLMVASYKNAQGNGLAV